MGEVSLEGKGPCSGPGDHTVHAEGAQPEEGVLSRERLPALCLSLPSALPRKVFLSPSVLHSSAQVADAPDAGLRPRMVGNQPGRRNPSDAVALSQLPGEWLNRGLL